MENLPSDFATHCQIGIPDLELRISIDKSHTRVNTDCGAFLIDTRNHARNSLHHGGPMWQSNGSQILGSYIWWTRHRRWRVLSWRLGSSNWKNSSLLHRGLRRSHGASIDSHGSRARNSGYHPFGALRRVVQTGQLCVRHRRCGE